MYYWFDYKRDYLVSMGSFYLIFLSVCNLIIFYCLQTVYINILIIIFLFYIPIYCSFILVAYQDLSEKHFSYILLIFLGFIVIIYSLSFFNPFLSKSLIYFLIEILIISGAEFCIIYVAICYIKERKNIINFYLDLNLNIKFINYYTKIDLLK